MGFMDERVMAKEGFVEWFSKDRGFGYIQPDDGSPLVFLYLCEVPPEERETLEENQRVSFEVALGPRGNSAINVRVL